MTGRTVDAAVFFLVGPTAVGKTDVAHMLAQKLGRELLSVDSMQVYTGMDIGTAKPSAEQRQTFTYHGLDLVTPDRTFTVWDYHDHALAAVRSAAGRKKSVIAMGGSGLHVKSLTDGLDPVPSADRSLREEWNGRMAAEGGIEALREEVMRSDPAAYAALKDKNNPRRLIRALERAGSTKSGLESWKKVARAKLVGMTMAAAELHKRIESRVRKMYADGLVDEAAGLLRRYGTLSDTALQAIGYREAFEILAGRCSEEEGIARTIVRTRQFAKRQMTWFRHQADVCWVDAGGGAAIATVVERIEEAWRKVGCTDVK